MAHAQGSPQPISSADYCVFAVTVSVDAAACAGGAIKFMNVPGGPADGYVCTIPSAGGSHGGVQQLIFSLRLSKEGAPDGKITIETVLYRKQIDEGEDGMAEEQALADGEEEDDDEEEEEEEDACGVDIDDDDDMKQELGRVDEGLPQRVLDQTVGRSLPPPLPPPPAPPPPPPLQQPPPLQ